MSVALVRGLNVKIVLPNPSMLLVRLSVQILDIIPNT